MWQIVTGVAMVVGPTADRAPTYTVAEPLDADGRCSVHDPTAGETYHVVDCADRRVREKLARRSVGDSVRLELSPADPDGLDWIVTRIRPGGPVTSGVRG